MEFLFLGVVPGTLAGMVSAAVMNSLLKSVCDNPR
jgi:hypothetical protein